MPISSFYSPCENSLSNACRILALFRMIFSGSSHPDLNMPAYGGELFDPEGFRAMKLFESPELRIRNRDVHLILRDLTFGRAKVARHYITQRYSYRTLDVEHIGYLYEGLLDHTAKRAGNQPLVKLVKGGEQAHELSTIKEQGTDYLVEFVRDNTRMRKREKIRELIESPDPKHQEQLKGLHSATMERCLPYASIIQTDEVVEPGHLYLSTSTSRRESGTHYTPIKYTRAMVEETLKPLVYKADHGKYEEPLTLKAPREILDLKVCDPAMGSGAFLVQVVRYLSEKLVEAWWERRRQFESAEGLYLPYGEPGTDLGEKIPIPEEREEALDWAKRFVTERCIYGVDKNRLAVEMAKLSLWLVSLSRERPFSFLDHALKCGDSLIGISSLKQLANWSLDDAEEKPADFFSALIAEQVEKAADLRRTLENLTTEELADVREKATLNAKAEEQLEELKALGDLIIAPEFVEASKTEKKKIRGHFQLRALDDTAALQKLQHEAQDLLGDVQTFHWPVEFPEVFQRENGGFDAMLGNPPFMGGQKITGNLGKPYREFLIKAYAKGKRGSVDLVAYFYLRVLRILRNAGNFGLLAINTISEGDTRQTGLEQVLEWGNTIYSAYPDEAWPGKAAVVTSRVHVHKGEWKGEYRLRGKEVDTISAFLSSREEWSPKKLKENANKSFQGSIVLGMGFVLSEEGAQELLEKDPRNKDVLFPYLNGRDLNSHPLQKPSRWVINFWDWPEEKARTYPDAFRIVEEEVKPQRMAQNDKGAKEKWWQFIRPRPELYHAIGRGHHFEKHPDDWDASRPPDESLIIVARVTKYPNFITIPNTVVPSEKTVIIPIARLAQPAVLNSGLHKAWAWYFSSSMKHDLNYSPSDCFETFPFPEDSLDKDDLGSIGNRLEVLRKKIMKDIWIGLTKLYNGFHDHKNQEEEIQELRELHIELDRAVAKAYSWGDLRLDHDFHKVGYLPSGDNVRFTISENARIEVLDRLVELNRDRHTQGLGES